MSDFRQYRGSNQSCPEFHKIVKMTNMKEFSVFQNKRKLQMFDRWPLDFSMQIGRKYKEMG